MIKIFYIFQFNFMTDMEVNFGKSNGTRYIFFMNRVELFSKIILVVRKHFFLWKTLKLRVV